MCVIRALVRCLHSVNRSRNLFISTDLFNSQVWANNLLIQSELLSLMFGLNRRRKKPACSFLFSNFVPIRCWCSSNVLILTETHEIKLRLKNFSLVNEEIRSLRSNVRIFSSTTIRIMCFMFREKIKLTDRGVLLFFRYHPLHLESKRETREIDWIQIV